MTPGNLEHRIDSAWQERETLPKEILSKLAAEVLDRLDSGEIRAADKVGSDWKANDWVKKGILLHFKSSESISMESGIFEFYDKIPVRREWPGLNVRVVPPAVVRRGAFVAPNCVLMPSYVNVGAWVGPGTMIDTWATVGSCAQVGARCHISGGVGIGGVLEPPQATPVIVEDNCFIGARSELAEGVIVRKGAVLAMGCYVGSSTKIYDATRKVFVKTGEIPENAVVVPGATQSSDGTHSTYTLIIKKYRDESTDAKTALNDVLR